MRRTCRRWSAAPAAGRRISPGSAGDLPAAHGISPARRGAHGIAASSVSGVGTPARRQNSSSVRIRIAGTAPACAFSSSARLSLFDFSRAMRLMPDAASSGSASALGVGPNPSAPMTTIVVFTLTSSAVAPPRRPTSSRASFRPSELSFPVKTTSCPASGKRLDSGEDEGNGPLRLHGWGDETASR